MSIAYQRKRNFVKMASICAAGRMLHSQIWRHENGLKILIILFQPYTSHLLQSTGEDSWVRKFTNKNLSLKIMKMQIKKSTILLQYWISEWINSAWWLGNYTMGQDWIKLRPTKKSQKILLPKDCEHQEIRLVKNLESF